MTEETRKIGGWDPDSVAKAAASDDVESLLKALEAGFAVNEWVAPEGSVCSTQQSR